MTCGLPEEAAVFRDSAIAFETTVARRRDGALGPRVVSDDGRDVLMSGSIRGEDRLTRHAAAVAMTYGKGKLVLLGFRPQYRAQTPATYPFLFNSLYWSTAK